MQNVREIIEDKVPVEMTNIQTKAKQKDNNVVANHQQEKETIGNKQRV